MYSGYLTVSIAVRFPVTFVEDALMPKLSSLENLQKRRQEVLSELAAIDDLRPGSLVERYRKCGKPNCHCANEPGGGHGPSWSLTRTVAGKTVTRVIPVAAVAQTREQIAEYHRFKELTNELIEVSTQICDARLRLNKASSETAQAEKGGSKKRLKAKLRSKLKD